MQTVVQRTEKILVYSMIGSETARWIVNEIEFLGAEYHSIVTSFVLPGILVECPRNQGTLGPKMLSDDAGERFRGSQWYQPTPFLSLDLAILVSHLYREQQILDLSRKSPLGVNLLREEK